jgi:hypothetical protein
LLWNDSSFEDLPELYSCSLFLRALEASESLELIPVRHLLGKKHSLDDENAANQKLKS